MRSGDGTETLRLTAMATPTLTYQDRPSAAASMLRILAQGVRRGPFPFPRVLARWRAAPDPGRLARFLHLTGLPSSAELPLLYLHVFTYPLHMVLLSHPACPLPSWKVLQVRNHLTQRGPVPRDRPLDVECWFSSQRVLAKGLEVDVRVTVAVGGEIAWEGLTTYYYRGRFGLPGPASPLAEAPPEPGPIGATWRTDSGGGLSFSTVSGDFNGIHYWGSYARRFGFRGSFHHPHALVGQCLARLEPRRGAQELGVWLKGPVYYGSHVGLAVRHDRSAIHFALTPAGSDRASIVGRWSHVAPGTGVLHRRGAPATGG